MVRSIWRRDARASCGLVTTLLLLAGAGPSAQPAAPRFEFVSLSRVPPLCGAIELRLNCERQVQPRASWRVFAGGRIEVTNQLALDLVRVAYGLERMASTFLSGAPGWMVNERYDLIALTGADGLPGQGMRSLPTQVRPMLRGLLEDRFKLRVRTVPKKTDVLVLSRTDSVPGRGLKASNETCPQASVEWDLPPCTKVTTGRLDATSISIAELTDVLSRMTQLPVIDETGISGRYDVSVELEPPRPGRPRTAFDLAAPIAAAVKRDLGLDLQRTKRMVDRVEIKNAERPVDD